MAWAPSKSAIAELGSDIYRTSGEARIRLARDPSLFDNDPRYQPDIGLASLGLGGLGLGRFWI
jgi:hypothetical protein